jgi:hypothetical protein
MRLLMLLFGLASIAWGASAYPVLSRYSSLEDLSQGVIERNAYRPEVLASMIPDVEAAEHDPYCHPEALRAAAVLRLRLAEDAMGAGERTAIAPDLQALDRTTHQALSYSPADPFLWMTLSWVEGVGEGFNRDQLNDLRLSYSLRANKGWVAVRRNRLAFADNALEAFARLLDCDLFGEAIAIFTRPGWPIREKLLPRLVGVRERDAFAKALSRLGYDGDVLGIRRRAQTPWN